jgi:hypothetical protein
MIEFIQKNYPESLPHTRLLMKGDQNYIPKDASTPTAHPPVQHRSS